MRRLRCRIPGVSAPRDTVCIASKSRDHLGTGVKHGRLIGGVTSSEAMRFSASCLRTYNGIMIWSTQRCSTYHVVDIPLKGDTM